VLRTIKDCSSLGDQKAAKESQKIGKKQEERTPGMNLFKIVNTTTSRVSAASASVTTADVSISTVELRTPPTTIKTIQLDEELAKRMHEEKIVEFEKRQSEIAATEEDSRAVIKVAINQELDNIQAMIKADEQMALRLQSKEQEQFTIKEKSRMLVKMTAEKEKVLCYTKSSRAKK
nr:hypothetical protein [Tanacetum cinerariifolium]